MRRVAVKVALGKVGIVGVVARSWPDRTVAIPTRFTLDDKVVYTW